FAGAVTFSARSRITSAPDVISSTVSPRTRRPIRKAAIWAGVASPDMTVSKAARALAASSVRPSASRAMMDLKSVMPPANSSRHFPDVQARKLQEVAQNVMPVFGGDAFRMELDAMDRQFLVLHAH